MTIRRTMAGNESGTGSAAAAGCQRCGESFRCDAASGGCWCESEQTLRTIDAAQPGCYCPGCLALLLAQEREMVERANAEKREP